ncbi:hypothetical protein C1I97_22390 [Streptomyces sp. NTH33]|uniref:hypothetical protein n=1 Tax=Streptomyces sp. NTH33 TaxID=1735453 RepID=UPI000DA87935|nr:hypothetical protein [Streptomyces sp. NTH33]PZH01473.1 hypothetical protein C1I97_22390 [Streptomyces sp. NTH33]
MPYGHGARRGGRRALRLRTLWHRCWGAGAVLLGVTLLLVAGFALVMVPSELAEEHAYRAARPCGAAVTEDCLRSVQATVRGTEIEERPKNERYELRLDGPSPVPRNLSMAGADPLLRHLRAGDVVTVTVWRDYATAVGKDGVTQDSDDTPEGQAAIAAAFALALAALGFFAAYAGGQAVAHAPGYAATGVPARLVLRGRFAVTAAACALPAGLVGMWTGPVGVIVLWSALAGLVLAMSRRAEIPGRGRHAAR